MQVANSVGDFPSGLPFPVVTLGNFDGVHLGHREMIRRLITKAESHGGTSVVITFRPHPVKILNPQRAPSLIGTYDDKIELLGSLGVDWIWELPFNRDFSEWSADQFVQTLLIDRIGVRHFLAGPDCHFGRNRQGDAELLEQWGEKTGFSVDRVPPITALGDTVSSSRIRRLVAESGDMVTAHQLLGRPIRLRGTVVKGDQRGRTIGFPTANLRPLTELLPCKGVYAAWAGTRNCRHRAVVNIGNKPTFGGCPVGVEAHLLDFDGNLYGEQLVLDLIERIRPEQRFESVERLVEQIAKDVTRGKEILD